VGAAANPAASVPPVDPLKYPSNERSTSAQSTSSSEMLTVKLRYKKPDGDRSELVERAVTDAPGNFENAPADLKFAAAVAEFGMILRDSEYKGNGPLRRSSSGRKKERAPTQMAIALDLSNWCAKRRR